VEIEVRFLRAGAFDVQNIITIPHAKLLRKLGDLTPEQLAQVEEVLLFWLGFEEETAENGE
jgi:mRNA interferase MazF